MAACSPHEPAQTTAFQGRIDDWTQEFIADSPELATQAGVADAAAQSRLDDQSAQAVEIRRSAAIRRLAELRGLDVSKLSPVERLTYDILAEQFSASAAAAEHDFGKFDAIEGVSPYVLNPLDSAFLTLPDFLDRRHRVAGPADVASYLQRLRQVAPAIDAEVERARADAEEGVIPPIYIVDATVRALEAAIGEPSGQQIYVSGLRTKLEALAPANEADAARASRLTADARTLSEAESIVRLSIIPAEQRAAAFLRGLRARAGDAPGVSALPDGAAFYRDALRLSTATDLTPDQIHRIGLDRVRELEGQLDLSLRRIGMTEGTVGVRLSALTADPRYRYPETEEGRAQLIADVQARIAHVMQLAPNWFGHLPKARLNVERVPPAAELSAPGAYYSPPSIDGASPGTYYINLRDLSEMTRIDVPTQDYHEAVPGHHFQIALAQEQTNIPVLRRLLSFNAFSEGWALYAEQLADEQGLYDDDPVGRIGYLRWQLWRAARLVVDTGLHARNWSRQQAIDYLLQTTGDAPGVVVTEVDRYIVWPGQACGYEIGRREIMRLREEARSRLGPDFDLKTFHDEVLLEGELPLSVLAARIEAWIQNPPPKRQATTRTRN